MIYVDDWRRRSNKRGKTVMCCHMVADTIAELHAFASCIGLPKYWFQKARKHPHYDIVSFPRYVLAVERGARIVDSKMILIKSKQMLEKQRQENIPENR